MPKYTPDIVIIGAGIAGLWLMYGLKKDGYDVLLLEKDAIGGVQTIASQGIIHSGLKFSLNGKTSELSRTIAAMPVRWNGLLKDELGATHILSNAQQLLIPKGFMGHLLKLITQKAMHAQVEERGQDDLPPALVKAGFEGKLVAVKNEPVLDIPSLIHALADPHRESIRKIDTDLESFLKIHDIRPRKIIFTAAGGNKEHKPDLKTQARPLLMGMLKPAPFPLYAHLVGPSDKPVATITTHKALSGEDVWYLGAGVAERPKDSDPQEVYEAIQKAFARYLPRVDIGAMEFATLPVDRIESKSPGELFIPDTPTIHEEGNRLYCWPTKLTFAPLLGDMVRERLEDLKPSGAQTDWSFLPPVDFALAPWDKAAWTNAASEKQA